MAGTPKKRERQERTAAFLASAEEAITTIIQRVTSGESLAQVCQDHDIPFSAVRGWIYESDSRAERYEDALKLRDRNHEDRVTDAMVALLDSDLTDAFRPDGSLKPLSEIPAPLRRWIVGLEVQEVRNAEGVPIGTLKKLRLGDKVKGLELLARKLKMLTDKHEIIAGQPTLAELLSDDRPRLVPVRELPSQSDATGEE